MGESRQVSVGGSRRWVFPLPAGTYQDGSRTAAGEETSVALAWGTTASLVCGSRFETGGPGGDRLFSHITRLGEKTIQRGRQERADTLAPRPVARVCLPGWWWSPQGGNEDPERASALLRVIEPEIMGDPRSEQEGGPQSFGPGMPALDDAWHPLSLPTLVLWLRKPGSTL